MPDEFTSPDHQYILPPDKGQTNSVHLNTAGASSVYGENDLRWSKRSISPSGKLKTSTESATSSASAVFSRRSKTTAEETHALSTGCGTLNMETPLNSIHWSPIGHGSSESGAILEADQVEKSHKRERPRNVSDKRESPSLSEPIAWKSTTGRRAAETAEEAENSGRRRAARRSLDKAFVNKLGEFVFSSANPDQEMSGSRSEAGPSSHTAPRFESRMRNLNHGNAQTLFETPRSRPASVAISDPESITALIESVDEWQSPPRRRGGMQQEGGRMIYVPRYAAQAHASSTSGKLSTTDGDGEVVPGPRRRSKTSRCAKEPVRAGTPSRVPSANMKEKRRHDPGPKTGSLAGGRTNKSHMVVDPEARHDRPEWITDGAKLKQPSLSLFGVKAASLNETHSLDDMRQWLPHSSTSEHYSAPFQSPFSRQQSPKPVKPSSSFTQPPSIPRRTTSTSGLPPSNFPRRTITRSRSLPLSNALPVRAPAARPSPKNTRPPPLSIPGPYPLLPSSFSKIKADALGSAPNLLPLSKQVITEERPSEDLGHRQNAVFVAGRACPKGAHEPKDLGVTKRTHVKANRQKAGGLTKKESVLRRSVRALTCGFLSMPMGNSKGKSKMKEALKSNGDGGAMEKPARYWPRLEITKRNSR